MTLDDWEKPLLPSKITQSSAQAVDQTYSIEFDNSASDTKSGIIYSPSVSDAPSTGRVDTNIYAVSSTVVGAYFRFTDKKNYYFVGFSLQDKVAYLIKANDDRGTVIDSDKVSGINTTTGTWFEYQFYLWEDSGNVHAHAEQYSSNSLTGAISLSDQNPAHSGGGSIGVGLHAEGTGDNGAKIYHDLTEVFY